MIALTRKWLTGALILTALLPFWSQSVSANSMLLDRMIVYFEPGKAPRQDIRVSNISDQNLYLQTEIYKVVNPGSDKEERIRITNPDEMKLLATPQKSVVRPKGQRSIRLVSLETPKEKEAVYRVTFRPVTADVEAEQSGIQLLVAYQALIFVRPEKPTFDLDMTSSNGKVTFTNKGNSNVVLRNGQQCASNEKDASCVEIPTGGRLYAGQSLTFDLPNKNKFIKFGVFNGAEEEIREFSL